MILWGTNLKDIWVPYRYNPIMTSESESVRQPLPAGSLLKRGQYQIRKAIGAGGFAITYLANQVGWNWPVAIKEYCPVGSVRTGGHVVCGPDTSTGEFEQGLKGFIQESQLLLRFTHPGIVRILDQFEEAGTAYLVEEFLDGVTLESILEKSGPLRFRKALSLVHQVGSALTVVHGAGLVHSDIKPENIFLCEGGLFVLIDFGLSRGYLSFGASQKGSRGLSPGYAPPEQYSVKSILGPSADIYGLAATAFHVLAGVSPPDAGSRQKGMALPAITSLGEQQQRIEDALFSALHLERDKRTQSVTDFLNHLGLDPSPRATPFSPPPLLDGARRLAHRAGVTCLTLRPGEGAVLYSGGRDGFARAWAWPQLEPLGQAKVHDQPVNCIAVCPDLTYVLTATESGAISFWDAHLTSQSTSVPLVARGPAVQSLIPRVRDGVFAASFADGTVSLLGPAMADPLTIQAHQGVVNHLSLHPSGLYLASGADDGLIRILSTVDLSVVMTLEGHSKPVMSVLFHPDGLHILSSSLDMSARLWSLATGECLRTFRGHSAGLKRAVFGGKDDALTLATDLCLRRFKLSSARLTQEIKLNHTNKLFKASEQHAKASYNCLVADYDRQMCATAGSDGIISVWRTP